MTYQSKNTLIMAVLFCGNTVFIPASFSAASTSVATTSSTTKSKALNGGVKKTTVTQHTQTTTWGQRHPKMKSSAQGAGIGAVAGGAAGLLTGRGVVRGAVIGGGTGAGVGAMRKTAVMERHPIANDVATGAAAGLGLGLAGGHRHTTANWTLA